MTKEKTQIIIMTMIFGNIMMGHVHLIIGRTSMSLQSALRSKKEALLLFVDMMTKKDYSSTPDV
ncbi:hypothetical protein D3C78_1510210 [compost metagenome]